MRARLTLVERFAKLVIPEPNSGCHLWIGASDDKGYGRLSYEGGKAKAHRLAWAMAHSEPTVGMCVLHRCDNPSCVNPAHLFLGSLKDNSRDCVSKGRHTSQKKVRCKRGHMYDERNTYRMPNGARNCRKCRNIATAKYYRSRHPEAA